MKKILKVCLCFVLAFGATFGLVACDKEEIKENTETVIETTTSIIPVEFTKETAEGIFGSALQNLLSSEKVNVLIKDNSVQNNDYSETAYEQKVLIKNGIRYNYIHSKDASVVTGKYNNKMCYLNINNKKYMEVPVDDNPNDNILPTISSMFLPCRLDFVDSFIEFSSSVVSGRYFNGATYINIKAGNENVKYVEAKIVDGYIVSINAILKNEQGSSVSWGSFEISYGDAVDVSMIPTTLDGYTLNNV